MSPRADAMPATKELHRLKVQHRSWLRGTRSCSNFWEMQAHARVIRRWMRPWRRLARRTALGSVLS